MRSDSFFKTTAAKAILLIALILFAWQVWDIVALVILALAIASALEPPIDYLERKQMPRLLAATVLYVFCAGIVALAFIFIVPPFVSEVVQFGREFPLLYEKFLAAFRSLDKFPVQNELVQYATKFFDGFAEKIFGSLLSVVQGATSIVILIVLSFYLLVRKQGVSDFLRLLTPLEYESYVLSVWNRTNKKLGRWLQGQILLGLIIGSLVYIGLTIIGVPFALALGILAGVLELVPFVGPVFSAVPAVLYGFFHSPALGLWLVGFYFLVQQIENHFIVPAMTRKMTGLNSVVVIIALIVGGKLGGIVGFLVSIPVTVLFAELLNDWGERKRISKTQES